MIVSLETPVIKGGWLNLCIESVLAQTSPEWELLLLWDGGDELSKIILEKYEKMNHPQIKVFFQERKGIAHSRRFLTEQSKGEFFLPLDDDDVITPDAIEKFINAAENMPWSGIIRARRGFIDEDGKSIEMQDWFPFEKRHYVHGMTRDIFNHSHPYIIRRSAYERTTGWEGFEEYHYAGEDCDIFAKIEEVSEIELIDECLYYYRIHPKRTSIKIGNSAADDMWRRIADSSIKRRGLPLKRTNDIQPFSYTRIKPSVPSQDMVNIVVPFWESNEAELSYEFNRPSNQISGDVFALNKSFDGKDRTYRQLLDPQQEIFDRLEIVCSSNGKVNGTLEAANLCLPLLCQNVKFQIVI
jgi:glycosyltransferase involved in cell wall biosynthesis